MPLLQHLSPNASRFRLFTNRDRGHATSSLDSDYLPLQLAAAHAGPVDRCTVRYCYRSVNNLGFKIHPLMWHPPESLRHSVRPARWPSADEAERSRWFSPLVLAGFISRSAPGCRRWCRGAPPTTASSPPTCSTGTGASPRGGRARIVVEATGIRDVPSGPLLRIGHDRFVPGLRRARARRCGARAAAARGSSSRSSTSSPIRRRPEPEKFFGRFLRDHRRAIATALGAAGDGRRGDVARGACARCPTSELAARPRRRASSRRCASATASASPTLHLPHIARAAARAARTLRRPRRRAREAAGFDGVELHYAHAYTMASFLSALNTARRRLRRPAREPRAAAARGLSRGARARSAPASSSAAASSATTCIEGGNRVDDAAYFGVEFARAGIDFLSLSRGGKFEDAKQPKVGWAAYPVHRPERLRVHADRDSRTRAARSAATCRCGARSARRCAPPASTTPVVVARRHPRLRAGRGDPRARRGRHRRRARASRSPIPTGSARCGSGRGDEVRRCDFTELLRGARPAAQAGDLQAVGSPRSDRARREADSEGKRRLTAPACSLKLDAAVNQPTALITVATNVSSAAITEEDL